MPCGIDEAFAKFVDIVGVSDSSCHLEEERMGRFATTTLEREQTNATRNLDYEKSGL